MNLIAAVDKNWAIGRSGRLLVSIPEDQRLFREETLGKVVVMGRKTLESLPGGQPLHGRTTIVLTRDPEYEVKGALVCRSVDEALEKLKNYPSEDIFIAGGEEIYRAFLPFCDVAHITYIDYAYEADTFFPDLDRDPDWKMILAGEEQTYFDLCYEFRLYRRIRGKNSPAAGK
ncbi:MAG TPA: dihydrofolate reductase [Candidatus Lachnoclostridium pullistercoris]|uniref:Dihydrofolate reductase n=1 Tax=Candidatus Lachnoclostridium pullistercoris TaxID=2838632 RepID=A0A9D2T518_9FIRM|nr:dihydrofolate reductase [Candidatus Lachnoclostridium pullistercoris]